MSRQLSKLVKGTICPARPLLSETPNVNPEPSVFPTRLSASSAAVAVEAQALGVVDGVTMRSRLRNRNRTKEISSEKCSSRIMPFESIPGPKPSIPFIGHAWQYFPWGRYSLFKLHEANYDKYKRYGHIVKEEYQWKRPIVQVFDPEDFEVVFRHQGKYPMRPVNEFVCQYRKQNPEKYDSSGIANSLGKEWFDLRSALSPVLSQMKEVDQIIPSLNSICEDATELFKSLRDSDTHEVSNLQDILYRLALESICMMCLDTRLGCLSADLKPQSEPYEMIQAAQNMFKAYQKLYYGLQIWKFFKTPSYRLLDSAESTIYNTTSHYIEKALQKLENRTSSEIGKSPTILETLLSLKGITSKERKLTVIDFISGGIFTVTNSLCFLLHHLAQNLEVQDKLYAEIQEHIPDGNLTAESLPKMKYLRACVKETFRLSPTVPGVMRVLPSDTVLSGYNVPAGTAVFCHFMVTCQLEKYFSEPKRFLPDRWLQPKHSSHPFCVLPFGYGNRMCAGRRFSQMELYAAAVKMVYKFKMSSETKEIDLTHAFIVVPSSPVSIIVNDR